MHKRILALAAVLSFAGLGLAQPASAGGDHGSHTNIQHIKSSPDDGCPTPWARDTFDRTTKITKQGYGKYKIEITDTGWFTTNAGAPSPGNSGVTIDTMVTGALSGHGYFTVIGAKLKGDAALATLQGVTLDNSAAACKSDVPAARTTGNWPKQFFDLGEKSKVSSINPWRWAYTTKCNGNVSEYRVESSKADENQGNITGKRCFEIPKIVVTPAGCDEQAAIAVVTNTNAYEITVKWVNGDFVQEDKVPAGGDAAFEFTTGVTKAYVKFGHKWKPLGEFPFVAPTACPTATPTQTTSPSPTVSPSVSPSASVSPSSSGIVIVPVSNGEQLPKTGAGVVVITVAGAALLVAGLSAFVIARRRKVRYVA